MMWRGISVMLMLAGAAACSAPERPDKSGALVFVSEDIPAGLDSDGPAAAIATTQTGFVNLMEPLVGYAAGPTNEDGVQRLDFNRFEGRLAESWSYDPGTLSWTFRLRRGVKSCAGNELTADDVLYTFARAKSVSGAAPIGWFLASVGSLAGFTPEVFNEPEKRKLGDEVVKLDRYTVRLRQSAPNKLFLPVLTTFGLLIFDSAEARRHATAADPWSHAYINGTTVPAFGPYCLERWAKGDAMVLRANPNYYGGKPAIERVVLKRIPQSSNRFILIDQGEAQLAERLTPRELARLKTKDDVAVRGVAGNESLFVHMNFKTPPFDRVELRRAVAAALPIDWIIANGYFGQARPWQGLVPSTYPGYRAVAQLTPPDANAARAHLAKAGFPGGKGLERYADAFRLTYIAEKEASLGRIAAAVRTALRGVGIPVELDPIPSTQYGDRQLVKKDLPFALNDQEKPVVVDAGYAVQLFFASAAAGGVNNMVNYQSPRVDALWLKARSEPDEAKRDALIATIQAQLAADVAWAPVVEYRTQWAMDKKLRGITWYPDNAVRFADLSYAP